MKKIEYLAVIPARKKSKKIIKKNVKKINKKILFDHTLDAAKKSKKIKKIIVTTDIKKLIKENSKKIFYIKRPKKLSTDNSSTESAIFHSLNRFKESTKETCRNVVLLQPTSPFRSSRDIDNAINLFEKKKYDSLFSAYEDKMCIWIKKDKKLKPITYNYNNRKMAQKMKKVIVENGAIFIFNCKKFYKYKVRLFEKIGCFFMNKKNSIEIDTKFDLMIAKKFDKS